MGQVTRPHQLFSIGLVRATSSEFVIKIHRQFRTNHNNNNNNNKARTHININIYIYIQLHNNTTSSSSITSPLPFCLISSILHCLPSGRCLSQACRCFVINREQFIYLHEAKIASSEAAIDVRLYGDPIRSDLIQRNHVVKLWRQLLWLACELVLFCK